MNAAPMRTLIVDDEASARRWLRALCTKAPDVTVVAECESAAEASRALRAGGIDLLLLDIQLGPYTGFQVLDGVPHAAVPCVVFVTAHDQFAVRAFERSAVDYLLKPVGEDRFRDALERVRKRLRGGVGGEVQAALRATLGPLERELLGARGVRSAPRLIAEREGAYHVIETADIESLEAEANYVHALRASDGRRYRMRGPLQSLLDVLEPADFVQVNRGAIVNLAHVARIDKDDDGDFTFVMKQATRQHAVGRSFRAAIGELVRGRGVEGMR
jgi:two-component system, LytTR family, response regulator